MAAVVAGWVWVAGPQVLMYAACTGRPRLAKVAVTLGVDPNVARVPLRERLLLTRIFVLPALRQGVQTRRRVRVPYVAGHVVTPLYEAAVFGRVKVARVLLESGADVDRGAVIGLPPASAAARRGDAGFVALLLSYSPDWSGDRYAFRSPLHFAAGEGSVPVAKLLVCAGLDVNALDDSAWTPLSWAAYAGHTEMVRFLLAQGANPNGEGNDLGFTCISKYKTPLQAAKEQGHLECAKLIKAHGGWGTPHRGIFVMTY
jgi:ankyrin repeat protein